MITSPELVAYIAEELQQGTAASQLRESLMGAGWSEADISNAIHDVAAGMEPLSVGASIHEDLAQVRSVVSHLASRVQTLEAQLATTGLLTMPRQLPAVHIPPPAMAPAPAAAPAPVAVMPPTPVPAHAHAHRPGIIRSTASGMVTIAGLVSVILFAVLIVGYASVAGAPAVFLEILGLGGLLLVAVAYQLARMRHGVAARFVLACAAIAWGAATYYTWQVHHALETSVAIAAMLFLFTAWIVVGRWFAHTAGR